MTLSSVASTWTRRKERVERQIASARGEGGQARLDDRRGAGAARPDPGRPRRARSTERPQLSSEATARSRPRERRPSAPDHSVAGETGDGYRWVVLAVTSVGALLASLTSGTLVIALPEILRDLHTDLFTLLWIVVGYTLAATVLVLNAGRFADQVGRARSYTAGFALFTAASVACALAPSALLLVAARLVQGVGGAFLMANSAALVTDAFPRRELGRALGINAMVVGAGLILGPILGGWLTQFGWQTVFWFNLPIGLIGTIAAATLLVEQGRHTARAGFDIAGSALYLVGLSGLVTALAFGGIYGWTTSWVLAGFGAFIVAAPAFLWVESHREAPLLDLRLFRNRLFALGNLTGLLNGVARNGVLFLLVFYLQGARGYDPVTAGLALAPLAVGLLVLSPISGALADRIGSRGPGHGRDAGHRRRPARAVRRSSVDTPYWQLAVWQLIIGAGSGLFISPEHERGDGRRPAGEARHGRRRPDDADPDGLRHQHRAVDRARRQRRRPDRSCCRSSRAPRSAPAAIDMAPFIKALHIAFGVGVVASLLGAVVSASRGGKQAIEDEAVARRPVTA